MSEEMKDFSAELEKSYEYMGDGEHDTDTLIAWENLRNYLNDKTDIKTQIIGIVKGGCICEIEGIRGFIPISKLSLEKVTDLNEWLLKDITVRVITADMDEDKLVLSAVDILKERRDKEISAKVSTIQVGDIFNGTVETIKDYGAFIKLTNGLTGLVHISQISLERIKHPRAVLKEEDEVRVIVTDVKDGKLSLSMKALLEEEKVKEEEDFVIPESESIGTSLADLLKNIKV